MELNTYHKFKNTMKKLLGIILLLASFGATSQLVQGTALKITGLNGIMQGNGTTNASAISNSSTVGQVFRVTGASAYGWGALDLSDGDAITGSLPTAYGGTGLSALGTALQQLRVNAGATALEYFTPAAALTFGTDNQIPYVNAGGTDFDYGNLTFDGTIGNVTGNWDVSGYVEAGNLRMTGNTLQSNDANGDILVSPNGSGDVVVPTTSRFYVGTGKTGLELSNTSIGNATGGSSITFPAATLSNIEIDPDGANVDITEGSLLLSGTTRISATGAFTGISATLSNTTNQLVLGTTNTVTLNSSAPAASRIYTIPDAGTNSSFQFGGAGATDRIPFYTSNNYVTTSSSNLRFDGSQLIVGGTLNASGALLGSSASLSATTNQIVSGTGGNLTTVNFPASSGAVTVTMPNVTSTVVYQGGALGTPLSGTLTNAIGLPISTGVSGLGTGVATALGVNVGTSGAFQRNNDGFNGTVGATTPNTGVFTSASVISASDGILKARTSGLVDDAILELTKGSSNTFGTANNFGFKLAYDGGTNNFDIISGNGTTVTTRFSINRDNGNVTSGGNLLINGTLGLTGTRVTDIFTTDQHTTNAETVDSDSTLKENVTQLPSQLSKIAQIKPVTHEWKDKIKRDSATHFSVIAQEIRAIYPEVVVSTLDSLGNETLGVRYQELIPPMIKAIQELSAQITELQQKVATLEAKK